MYISTCMYKISIISYGVNGQKSEFNCIYIKLNNAFSERILSRKRNSLWLTFKVIVILNEINEITNTLNETINY